MIYSESLRLIKLLICIYMKKNSNVQNYGLEKNVLTLTSFSKTVLKTNSRMKEERTIYSDVDVLG